MTKPPNGIIISIESEENKMRVAWNGKEWVLYGWQEWENGESNWDVLARGSKEIVLEIMGIYMEEMEK